mmetsp:Transcript_46012/g.75065  ORF Transcript_46012/g.75065 Transcript_46012/m.75065 type:complete len:783 (-) Transcript_46012:1348-3696(-)
MQSARSIFLQALGPKVDRLDDTVLDYIVGIIDDKDTPFSANGADLCDLIGPFLSDTGATESDQDALRVCKAIVKELHSLGLNLEVKSDIPTILAAPVKLASIAAAPKTAGLDLVTNEAFSSANLDSDDEDDILDEDGKPIPKDRVKELPEYGMSVKDELKRKKREERVTRRQAMLEAAAQVVQGRALNVGTQAVKIHTKGTGLGNRNIHIDNLTIAFGGSTLFVDSSMSLAFGRRYGVVGRNGIGKSTLLRAISNREVAVPKNMQILYIEQEEAGSDMNALECVLVCDVERQSLLKEEKDLVEQLQAIKGTPSTATAAAPNLPHAGKAASIATVTSSTGSGAAKKPETLEEKLNARLNEVYNRLGEISADTAEARASSILAGLQFTPEMQTKPSSAFSGGWRMRIALARALFCEPDLLLLDEPTNHLDLHACLWLESYLSKWKNTLLVVSHARDFLNAVATDIIHAFDKKLWQYSGNYDQFEKSRAEKMKNLQRAHDSQEMRRKHIQKFIDRFRYNAKRASMAQSRIKLLQKMQDIPLIEDDPNFRFEFPVPEELPASHSSIQVVDVTFGYAQDKPLLKGLNFAVDTESRITLVGANGAGKSTLLKMLSGELKPLVGRVEMSGKLRLGMFTQHHVDSLNLKLTPLEHMQQSFPGIPPQTLRSHLGSMGVSGELAIRPMSTLSGGQKSRVSFAVITWTKPHILLLDEPTNHLDIDTIDALIEALNAFEGGVVLVTHDQRLIAAVCDELWVCDAGKVKPFPGDFDQYKQKMIQKMQLKKGITVK